MATPVVRAVAVSAQEGNSPASNTVTKPTGTASGDLLLAVIATDETSNTWLGLPSGFAELAVNGRSTQTATQPKFQVAYKFAGGSEGASYAFPVPAFMANIIWLYAITGVTSGSEIVYAGTVARGSSTACAAPSIAYATHGGTDPLVITGHAAVVEYSNRTFSTPTGMTSRGGNLDAEWMMGAGFSIGLTGAVASGSRSSTISASEPWTALSVIVAEGFVAPTAPTRMFLPF